MRRPRFVSTVEGRADAKMTPMIDVVFLLLIFFLLTSTFQPAEELLPTNLPSTGAVQAEVALPPELQDLEQVVLELRLEDGRLVVELNGQPYGDLAGLRSVLVGTAEAPGLGHVAPEIPVILDVDGQVPLGSVVEVYDLCRLAEFERVHFAARPESLEASVPSRE